MKLDSGWCYATSFLSAAQAVANKLRVNGNVDIAEICRDYGIFLEQMNNSEIEEFLEVVESYVN